MVIIILCADDTKPGQPAGEHWGAEISIIQRRLVRVAAAAVVVVGWGGVLVAPTGASAAIINSTVHGLVLDIFPQDGTGDMIILDVVEIGNLVSGLQEHGVIKFDISSLTTPITSADLKLTQTGSILPGSRTFEVLGYTGNGTLELADYSPPGASVIGTFEHFNEATEEFDVTAFIFLGERQFGHAQY